MKRLSKFVATVSFIGYCPFAPGTVASLAAVPLYILVRNNSTIYYLVTALLLSAGFWSISRLKPELIKKDPSYIVIDEFASLLLVYIFIPFSVKFLVTGFILFRIFDILKIPPIKKLERLPGSPGIMLDDIACAILTNLILQILNYSFHSWMA